MACFLVGPSQSAVLSPSLSAAVNDGRDVQVFQGWPLVLEVFLSHPQAFDSAATPLKLANTQGAWSDYLQITVRNSAGTIESWPFKLLNTTLPEIRLDGESAAQLFWSLAPSQTALLSAGTYRIEVVLDTTGTSSAESWKGKVRSGVVTVRMASPPSVLSPAQREARSRYFVQYYLDTQQTQEALAETERLLQETPTSIAGLRLRAAVLQDLGRPTEALQAIDRALDEIEAQYPAALEPPRELLREKASLQRALQVSRLTSIQILDGTLSLEWNVDPGQQYQLQSSSDLLTWVTTVPAWRAESNLLIWKTNRLLNREFFRLNR